MSPTASAPLLPERVKLLSGAGQAAYVEFRRTGAAAALDPLIFAILEAHLPRTLEQPMSDQPRDTLLMDGLGFDSLAITEVVFFTEDLFGVTISNEEIYQVRTIDDLCAFVRRKIDAR
jgi:acyl carrier protein